MKAWVRALVSPKWREALRAWRAMMWYRLLALATERLYHNVNQSSLRRAANRIQYAMRVGDAEIVVTFADKTKPDALSKEEVIQIEQLAMRERLRMQWPK